MFHVCVLYDVHSSLHMTFSEFQSLCGLGVLQVFIVFVRANHAKVKSSIRFGAVEAINETSIKCGSEVHWLPCGVVSGVKKHV